MTQAAAILEYMREHGSISSKEAINDLDIYRLASRISDLKKEGYNITKRLEKGGKRYEKPSHFAVYTLEE